MKLLLLTTCFVTLLSAQTPFEIRGTVSEPGLSGIAGAEVQATLSGPPGSPRTTLTAFTDGRGQFVIRTTSPGPYVFDAGLEGYGPAGLDRSIKQVDAEHPRVEVSLFLVRPSQAIGRVLDAETRQPVEGVQVSLVRKVVGAAGVTSGPAFPLFSTTLTLEQRTKAVAQFTADLTTKADGTFRITGLPPGEYTATVVRAAGSQWTSGYSADDLKIIDRGDEVRYWPGGVPMEAVQPLTLGSGAVVSFGDILLKEIPHYRAHVSLEQGSCPEGESMRITLFRKGGPNTQPMEAFPCGSELLLRRLEPGSYWLYAVSDWQGSRDNIEDAAWATAQFEISDKNTEVTITPQRGVILEGRLVAADPTVILPDRILLAAQPEEPTPGMKIAAEDFFEWLENGAFRVAVSPRPLEIDRRYARGSSYVKQLRYNGSPLPDFKLPLNPGAGAQRLDIVMDNKFGEIVGTVSGAAPVVSLWTAGSTNPTNILVTNGEFRSGPLIPGAYRATLAATRAVMGSVATVFDPNQPGEKVTVRPGETTTIQLK